MIKYLFLGGPLDGTQRATGGCNPWRMRTRTKARATQTFTYVLHAFNAGTRRYSVYVLQGSPAPSVAVMQQLIGKHMLEAETVAPKSAPAIYLTGGGAKVFE